MTHALALIVLAPAALALRAPCNQPSRPQSALSRRAVVGAGAALLVAPATAGAAPSAAEVDAAVQSVRKAQACKTASCQKATSEQLRSILAFEDAPRNARGTPARRLPTVSSKRFRGLKPGTPSRIKLKLLAPEGEVPQIMWLVEKDTGRVLSCRSWTQEERDAGGPAKMLWISIFTEDELAAVSREPLVSRTYWSDDGLWESEPFTLGQYLPTGDASSDDA